MRITYTIPGHLNNLGVVYEELGNIKEAEERYDRALSIQMKLSAETHYLTGVIYSNLALIYKQTGRYKEALCGFKKSLNILNLYPTSNSHVLPILNREMQELSEIMGRGN